MVAESEDLVTDAGIACGLGVLLFVVSYSGIVCPRHVKDVSEIPHLQALVKCHRVLSAIFILLLLPLFWNAAADGHPVITPITSFGNGYSWNFGWARPVAHFAFVFTGSFLDFHPAARLSCLVGMMQAVAFDTLSSYDLGTQIACVASGNCAVPKHYSLLGLRLLNMRDLVSVALGTWGLLTIVYLTAIIGVCSTRYRFRFRQLHAGDHNRVWIMQNELAKRMRDRDDSSDL